MVLHKQSFSAHAPLKNKKNVGLGLSINESGPSDELYMNGNFSYLPIDLGYEKSCRLIKSRT
jgi:hypothetical protein